MHFYASIFENSRVTGVSRGPDGRATSATAELDGVELMALNAGPRFTFTEAISFFVKCETQEGVDRLWAVLTPGGEEGRCGWLKDKYGLSWQIVPTHRVRCSATRIRNERTAPCRRCCRWGRSTSRR